MSSNGYTNDVKVQHIYKVIGFISSGTYGRVYKAVARNGGREVAIKKFKPDKEGEVAQYTGISQSACREMALCAELSHPNIIHLIQTMLEEKCIFMIFEYAEHDLLQIIHYHTQPGRNPIPGSTIKSIMFQLLNGLVYLHSNWVLHRDLKPANIMVTKGGEVKIGDLGLARLFYKPIHSLYSGDKVVVTIWYRAPELLLGTKHYTPAVDMWAVGCIFAELLSLRPIFKGEEMKMDGKKTVPFQRNQMYKIIETVGLPTKDRWPSVVHLPEYGQLQSFKVPGGGGGRGGPPSIEKWYWTTLHNQNYTNSSSLGPEGCKLLCALLEYDPGKRLTAKDALQHPYFTGDGQKVSSNCFDGIDMEYPRRKIAEPPERLYSVPATKRSALPDDFMDQRPTKRLKEG
ncbi:MAG: cyclin-dependent protein kinase [Peltula sp. TS41687]|nr:MAG: cyclin-dependent protein kinase [Peltula sp. TS41687]